MIRKNTHISGIGVHTGEPSQVIIEKNNPNTGIKIYWKKKDLFEIIHQRKCQFSALYSTMINFEDGSELRAPEHLLGTLIGLKKRNNIKVYLSGKELPILDGSGSPWLLEIENNFEPEFTSHIEFSQYSCGLKKEYPFDGGLFAVEPSSNFKVSYHLDLGNLNHQFDFELNQVETVNSFLNFIVPARTFITWKSFQQARKNGLLLGVTNHSGLLIAQTREEYETACGEIKFRGKYPLINSDGFRMENELASHKILDLIGDLSLNGMALPKLHIKAKNSGHFQNHQLLKDLIYANKT